MPPPQITPTAFNRSSPTPSRTNTKSIWTTYVLTLPDLDVRVFLEATYADTRARRVARARDVDSPFVERVLAIEHEIIARLANVADVVVDREFGVRTRRAVSPRAAGGRSP